jgi:hypothetical protein
MIKRNKILLLPKKKKNCATLCEPLNRAKQLTPNMYPKEPNEIESQSFQDLKEALIDEDVLLVKPDFNKLFILQTDASGHGLSAILSQKVEKDGVEQERVVSYASRTLTKAERIWHTQELEALAVIWGCEHYRPYLIGRRFLIKTDNSALLWLHNQNKPGRLERWVLRLSEFEYDIRHRPGTKNGNADGPSRNPVPYHDGDEAWLNAMTV